MMSTSESMAFIRLNNPAQYEDLLILRNANPEKFVSSLKQSIDQLKHSNTLATTSPVQEQDVLDRFCVDLEEEDGIRYTDGYFNIEESKYLSDRILREKNKLIFVISNSEILSGKILAEVNPFAQKITVLSAATQYKNAVEVSHIFGLGERPDKRGWKIIKTVKADLWIYNFESGNRRYLLLSESKLEINSLVVEGMVLELQDIQLIGQNKTLSVGLPLIFVHSVKRKNIFFKSTTELKEFSKQKNITYDSFFNWLFSWKGISYRQPDYYESLIGAFLLSGKEDNYPLHLFELARQGTGKSTREEALYSKFNESVPIFEGSGSTLKTLIPSFKGNFPEPGGLIKSIRLCVIDEFLRILMRVHHNDRQNELAVLNPLLEHRHRMFGSGHGSITAACSSKAFAVSNPIWGTSCAETMVQHIDNSFLSRWFIWYQDQEHIRWVEEKKGIEPPLSTLTNEEWLSVYDFTQSFQVTIDPARLKMIFDKGLSLLGNDSQENVLSKVRDLYTARYRHHLTLIIDGLVKLRCLCTQSDLFIPQDSDYLATETIWFRMLVGWGLPIDTLHSSLLNRRTYEKVAVNCQSIKEKSRLTMEVLQ